MGLGKTVMSASVPHVIIMGIRGIPAAHGGFETFAERLALYLVERGWKVTVYCQGSESGVRTEDLWQGVHRIHIPVRSDGAIGTIEFDVRATFDVMRVPGTILTLGYNTGFLCTLLAARGRRNLINMDGLEWKRAKYSVPAKTYLWINERLAAWSGTHLIADHPVIADHLATRVRRSRITTIPYGAASIESANAGILADYGIEPYRYCTVIARAEPENSILEMVKGFSAKPRGIKLVVLGKYNRDHPYQSSVLDAASDEVIFPGPVYETERVQALRVYSLAYLHGHQVGGTNPSLVEALGAGNAVIGHDNPFNRWVSGDGALYFSNADEFSQRLDEILANPDRRGELATASRRRWQEAFTWQQILEDYERALLSDAPASR